MDAAADNSATSAHAVAAPCRQDLHRRGLPGQDLQLRGLELLRLLLCWPPLRRTHLSRFRNSSTSWTSSWRSSTSASLRATATATRP
eukprot:5105433-Alexandrium_andersonii.AAC.1